MTTVSAEAKLIPNPPALVDNRKQKSYKTDESSYCACKIPPVRPSSKSFINYTLHLLLH